MAKTEVFPRFEAVPPAPIQEDRGADVAIASWHVRAAIRNLEALIADKAVPRVERSRCRGMRHQAIQISEKLAGMRLRSENWYSDNDLEETA